MEQTANNAITTLSAAITSTSATTLTVTSASLLPPSGTFRLLIDSEILKVTGVSGTTLTVARGDGGTNAATHASGATVVAIMTKEAIDSIVTIQVAGTEVSDRRVINFVSGVAATDNATSSRCDITISALPSGGSAGNVLTLVGSPTPTAMWEAPAASGNTIGYGAGASRPAAGTKGNIYIPSDGVITSLDTGSTWIGQNPFGAKFTIPPVVSSWTKTSDGTNGTSSDIPGGGIFLGNNNNDTTGWVCLLRALSSGTSYTVVAALNNVTPNASGNLMGIVLSNGTNMISFGPGPDASDTWEAHTWTGTSFGTLNTNLLSKFDYGSIGPVMWVSIVNNGTTRQYKISPDGINWITFYSEAFNTYISETVAGVFIKTSNTIQGSGVTYFSWSGA